MLREGQQVAARCSFGVLDAGGKPGEDTDVNVRRPCKIPEPAKLAYKIGVPVFRSLGLSQTSQLSR